MKKIKHLLDFIKNNNLSDIQNILDVGAGDCNVSLYFAEKGKNVEVVEPNPDEKCNDKKINVIKKPIESHDLPESHYDLVIMRSVIHYINPEKLFKNVLPKIENAIRKNGLLYIFTMTPPEDSPRYTHYPKEISNNLKKLNLVKKKENRQSTKLEEEHISWHLIYKK